MKFKTLNISKYHNIIISKINNTVIIVNIHIKLNEAELFLRFFNNSKNKLLFNDVSLLSLSFKGFISILNNSLFPRNILKPNNNKGAIRPANQNLVIVLVVLITLTSSADILEAIGLLCTNLL